MAGLYLLCTLSNTERLNSALILAIGVCKQHLLREGGRKGATQIFFTLDCQNPGTEQSRKSGEQLPPPSVRTMLSSAGLQKTGEVRCFLLNCCTFTLFIQDFHGKGGAERRHPESDGGV